MSSHREHETGKGQLCKFNDGEVTECKIHEDDGLKVQCFHGGYMGGVFDSYFESNPILTSNTMMECIYAILYALSSFIFEYIFSFFTRIFFCVALFNIQKIWTIFIFILSDSIVVIAYYHWNHWTLCSHTKYHVRIQEFKKHFKQ